MYRYQCNKSRITNKWVSKTPPKDTNKAVIINYREMEIYELSKEGLRIITKKFSELQEYTVI